MKINKNIFICLLLVLVMLCIIGTASATDSLNENMTSDASDDAINVETVGDGDLASDSTDNKLSDSGTTIYVDGSYSGEEQGTETNPYKTISGAVGAATGGETIFI
ncbi:hypothetical protein, partial [uncultured Methanobrevibacter sp.]|uniref:hypothetical protein n=1 Tax=uncultured Methanobrevibacter sp. TaxID=253161 RepID=UPI002607DD11